MPEQKLSVTARMVVTVEVTAHSTWGQSTTMEQVHKQGAEDAINALDRLIREAAQKGQRITVVGTPTMKTVTAVQEKD